MRKYNILIDLDRLKVIHSGLGQVAWLFGKELSKLNDPQLKFTFLVPPKFKGKFGDTVDYETTSLKRRYLPFLCRKYDLWHAIHQDSAYFPGKKDIPYLLTIHDLNFLGEKSASKAQRRLRLLQTRINRASEIIAISKFTREVITQYLNLGQKTVKVIYNGVEQKGNFSSQKPPFLPEGKFLFTISVVKQKKNFKVLVDFINDLNGYNLVIAGNKSGKYAQELAAIILAKGLQSKIIMPGEITDEDKHWLYQNCDAFVFPSMHEGFGLPVIEAMNFGKPVFLSTCSSLPEIGNSHAFYWENFDSQHMSTICREKMILFSENKDKQKEMIRYAQQFTWGKNVSEYLQLYRKVLQI